MLVLDRSQRARAKLQETELGLLMPAPLTVTWSPKTGDWILEPFEKLSRTALYECDVVRVSLESRSGATGLAVVDIKAPDIIPIFRLHFETTSASLQLVKIDDDDPVEEYGRIDQTDYAEPDWYFLRTFRCDLEMRSSKQFYEWVESSP